MPLTRAALLFALTLAAASLTAHAQTMPTLQVYSRETIVDVLVTDKDGHPVHNLKPSDFTVTEDGKPNPSVAFWKPAKIFHSPQKPPSHSVNSRPTATPISSPPPPPGPSTSFCSTT